MPSRISRGSSTVFSPQFPDVQLFYLLAVTIQLLGGSLLTFWCLLELWVYIVPFKWGANELLRVSTTWSIIRIWSFPAFPSLKKPETLGFLHFASLGVWGWDGIGSWSIINHLTVWGFILTFETQGFTIGSGRDSSNLGFIIVFFMLYKLWIMILQDWWTSGSVLLTWEVVNKSRSLWIFPAIGH